MIKLPENFENKKHIRRKNRGMTLEQELNESNKYYVDHDIAIIFKKATPIHVVKADGAKIDEAYYQEKIGSDYSGLYKGKYIDFEAKTTQSITSFPISNIRDHQIEHFKNVRKHKGYPFIIVEFERLGRYYILNAQYVFNAIDNGMKSLPLDYFEKYGRRIKRGLGLPLDYLKEINWF